MKIEEFEVETWMTDHETHCQYNLTETCVSSLSLNDLQQYVEEDIASSIMSMTMDYGPIVGSTRLKQAILSLYQTGSADNAVSYTHLDVYKRQDLSIRVIDAGFGCH